MFIIEFISYNFNLQYEKYYSCLALTAKEMSYETSPILKILTFVFYE